MRGMIRSRSKGSWQVTLECGHDPVTKRRQRRTFTVRGTKKEAERQMIAALQALETGNGVGPSKETVGEFLERWLRDAARPSLAPRTLERYEDAVRKHMVPAMGALRLTELRPRHIVEAEQAWLEHGRLRGTGGLSPSTVLHHHRVLRKALQQAIRWQVLGANPADGVTPPKAIRREMSVLDTAQAATFLTAIEGAEFQFPLLTALYSGVRLGELLGMRWSDLDLNTGHFRVQQTLQRPRAGGVEYGPPKTHRSRRAVALPSVVLDALRRQRASQSGQQLAAGPAWQGNDLVFTDALGRPLNATRMRKAFHRVLLDAGLPRIRLHDLRHTMASLMLAAGVHPKVVSERLGHATINITLDTYSHVLPGLQEAAAEDLAAALATASRHEVDGLDAR